MGGAPIADALLDAIADWNRFWQAFGNPAVMIAFGALAEVNLFLFWSSIGQLLNG